MKQRLKIYGNGVRSEPYQRPTTKIKESMNGSAQMKTTTELAKECGINSHQAGWPELERLVALVRADERKACLARIKVLPNPHEYCQVSERAHNMAAAAFCAAIQAVDKV